MEDLDEHVAGDAVDACNYTYEHGRSAIVLRADGTVRLRTLPAILRDPEDGDVRYVACETFGRDGSRDLTTAHEHVRFL